MALTDDLISQFVKITNDKKDVKTENTVYGTIKKKDGRTFVQLDGADKETLTPVTEAASTVDGERVTVMIKNHTAIVTGNISSPLARSGDVTTLNNTVHEFGTVLAQKVSTEQLDAESARIDELVASDATIKGLLEANDANVGQLQADYITVKNSLTVAQADIENLESTKLDVEIASATYATVENLNATNAKVHNLEVTYGEFEALTANKFTAVNASIENLQANKLDASIASITYATIAELDAAVADISTLEADVANIDTLIFGSATGDTIQTSFANAVIAQLGDAQIKSAMIESLSADKITAGDVITNNVRVRSEDGSLVISDETMQISDENRVRVQIGKDADGDYSINIWDQNGNLMFSKGGITDSAIKEAIIRNDMVSDTANIAAHKLDIDSLFEEINGSTKTIKSSRVFLDDKSQSLDVAFKTMETDLSGLKDTVTSQGTQLSVVQGQIASKVWQQDINTAKGVMLTQYSKLEQDLSGFKTTVSKTYATSADLDAINIGGRNLLLNSENGYDFTGQSFHESTHAGTKITCTVDGGKADHYRMVTTKMAILPSELSAEVGTELTFSAEVKIVGSIVNPRMTFDLRDTVTHTKNPFIRAYADPSVTDKWQRISGTAVIVEGDDAMNDALIAMLYDSATIDSTIEYRRVKVERGNRPTDWTPAPEDVDAAIGELDDRLTSANTIIEQNTQSIEAKATKTEVITAKSEAISAANANTDNLLKNYSTTAQMDAAIKLKADGITSSVSATYATKDSLNTTNNNVTSAMKAATDAQSDIDNLTIGGRNYASLMNLKRYTGGVLYEPLSYWTIEGTKITAVEQPLSGPMPGFKIDVTGECIFVVSGITDLTLLKTYRKCFDVDGAEIRGQVSSNTTVADGKFVLQFTVPDNTVYFNIGVGSDTVSDYYIDRLKIECGTKRTDWTPAPEDMATSQDIDKAYTAAEAAQTTATNAETLIQQLSHSISTLVTDGNGTSLMTQTEDGWTFSTADIQTNVANIAEDLNTLTNDLGSTDNTVDVLKRAVDDLGEIAEYVKIGTYENEPCIELGESDSEFKMRITNTRILFMEGSNVVAHISNQSLHIKKAVIEEELQQGDFVWQIRSNGNLGLIWKG